MTVAVSRAKARGAEAVICASTGNTSASAAAYAARAGMLGAVIVPEGNIAVGKLAQALMHGARVIALQGNFDDALPSSASWPAPPDRPGQLGQPLPHRGAEDRRIRGGRRAGRRARRPCIPVGNAGNITAYWRASTIRRGAGPLGFQAAGAAPLVLGEPVENPETVASAIRIGNPARWEEAMDAFTASRGRVAAVTDEQILDAYRWLAATEGVFCEPASAASVAGLLAQGLPVARGGARRRSSACSPATASRTPTPRSARRRAVIGCENDLPRSSGPSSIDRPPPARPRSRLLGQPRARATT